MVGGLLPLKKVLITEISIHPKKKILQTTDIVTIISMQTFYYHPVVHYQLQNRSNEDTGGVAQARFEMTESTVQWTQDYIHTVLCRCFWDRKGLSAHRSATKRPPLLPILTVWMEKNMRKKTPPHQYFFNRSNACYIMIKVRKMCTFHQWVTRKQGFRMAAWWCRKSKSQMPQWMTHNKANHSSMMTDDKVYDASNWQQMTKSSTPQGNTHDKVHNASTDGTWQSPQGLNSMKIKHTSHACLLWNWLFFTLHASSAVKSVGTETS